MSMPFYVSPEQVMKDRADYARKGIGRGRSLVALECAAGVLIVADNPSKTLSTTDIALNYGKGGGQMTNLAPIAAFTATVNKLAVAFDGSKEARAALEWASGVAAAMAAQLRLVAVVAPPPAPIDTWAASVPGEAWDSGLSYTQTAEAIDALREHMERELSAAAASAGPATATAAVVGDPRQQLHDIAAEVDMLVVGSHRRGRISGALSGSVSRGLAHSCPAPLAIVPRTRQATGLIEFLMNRTLPSANRALTPPGCMLVAGREMLPLSLQLALHCGRQTLKGYCLSLGVCATLKSAPSEADDQR